MCRLGGDERAFLPVMAYGDERDVHDNDVQYEWFEMVNSGHLYRI